MAGLVNPGGGRPPRESSAPPGHSRALKDLVRSTLSLGADDTVLIQQLACTEPGCPPVETVVAVLASPRRTWKFAMATADLTPAHLRDTLKNHPRGRDHDKHD